MNIFYKRTSKKNVLYIYIYINIIHFIYFKIQLLLMLPPKKELNLNKITFNK